jgi:hypothetical protein
MADQAGNGDEIRQWAACCSAGAGSSLWKPADLASKRRSLKIISRLKADKDKAAFATAYRKREVRALWREQRTHC